MNVNGELPQGWRLAKIGEITLPIIKIDPKQYPERKFRYLDISGIDNTKNKIVEHKVYSSKDAPSRARQLVQAEDVLFSTVRTYLRNIAKVPKSFDGEVASTGFSILRAAEGIIPDFLFYFTLTSQFLNPLADLQRGTSYPAVRDNDVRDQKIPIPPLNEQKRIVAKIEELFSELDKGVESLQTAQAQLKTYRQALLKHAFEGKLTAQWREENGDRLEPAECLLQRIKAERQARYKAEAAWEAEVEAWEAAGKQGKKPRKPRPLKALSPLTPDELTKLPELPAGWMWVKVGELCDVVRGGSPRPAGDPKFYGGNIPFLKVADITHNISPYLHDFTYTITEAGLAKTRQILPNTLLLSNSGATLGVPKICMIEATMNDGIAAFLGLPEGSLLYHYYFWFSKTQELRSIDQGAAQPNLNTNLIQEILIPLCSELEQSAVIKEIESRLSVVDRLEQTITESLQKAEALRQVILKKAFAGQLVPQDPDDEPAADLLARIRAAKS